MKFHAILLLTAGLSAATMLAACQKNGGGRATVKDGRSDRAKAGQRDATLETLSIQCKGSVIVDGVKFDVDKLISWDQLQSKSESVFKPEEENTDNGRFLLSLTTPEKNGPATLGVYTTLTDGKEIGALGSLGSQVKLTVDSTTTKKVVSNILCAVVSKNSNQRPIKVDKDKKAEVLCGGMASVGEDKKAIKDDKVMVGGTEKAIIDYADLNVGKDLPKVAMTSTLALSEKQDVRTSIVEILSEDKKLKVKAEVLNNLGIFLTVNSSSKDEIANLQYRCATTAPATIEREVEEGKISEDEQSPTTTTTTTSTTRQEDLGGLLD